MNLELAQYFVFLSLILCGFSSSCTIRWVFAHIVNRMSAYGKLPT